MTELKAYLLFAGVLGILCIYIAYSSVKANSDRRSRKQEESKKWLEEEKKEPLSFIEFTLVTGEVIRGHTFVPTTGGFEHYIVNNTSQENAENAIVASMKRGFFTDKENNAYPVGQVKMARILKNNKAYE